MSGVKGRSGRKTASIEEQRFRTRQLAWERAEQFLSATIRNKTDKKDQAWYAQGIVKVDMAKPIVIDQSKNTYITSIQVENMKPEELVDIAMGRQVER